MGRKGEREGEGAGRERNKGRKEGAIYFIVALCSLRRRRKRRNSKTVNSDSCLEVTK